MASDHAWYKNLHFLQSSEVHIYERDVWQAVGEANQNETKT